MALALVPLISLGLSLLPKLPAAWGAIAGLFGKKVPETVTEAGQLAEGVLGSLKASTLSPEAQIELEKIFKSHEQTMANITLDERKIEMTGILGAQQVEIASYKSEDEYVKRTRPKILRGLFYLMAVYLLMLPWVVVLLNYLKVEDAEVFLVMSGLKEAFLYVCATFSIAYTGYNVVRSQEKKAGCESASGSDENGGIIKGFNPFGKK